MPVYANTTVAAGTDGIAYASAVAVPAAESTLYNQTLVPFPDPVPCQYTQAVSAIVELAVTGSPSANSTYVVLQTDWGDGVWVDVAWCVWTATSGTATFVLMGGGTGCNAVQQTRSSGTAPSSTGAAQVALGGRFRFVGKATLTGSGSSSSSGQGAGPQVTATIRFRRYDSHGSLRV